MAIRSRLLRLWRRWLGHLKCLSTSSSTIGEEPPKLPNLLKRKTADDIVWGSSGKEARLLSNVAETSGPRRRKRQKASDVVGSENGGRRNGRKSIAA